MHPLQRQKRGNRKPVINSDWVKGTDLKSLLEHSRRGSARTTGGRRHFLSSCKASADERSPAGGLGGGVIARCAPPFSPPRALKSARQAVGTTQISSGGGALVWADLLLVGTPARQQALLPKPCASSVGALKVREVKTLNLDKVAGQR